MTECSAPERMLQQIPPGHLNLMGYVGQSQVNGPGCRAVIWVQGCHRGCSGCFNPQSWPFRLNQLYAIEQLAQEILDNPNHEGVTFSGGEPFWQAAGLADLARRVKKAGLNVMAFSGFRLQELQSVQAPPAAAELLGELDVLVDGPFLESQAIHDPQSLVSSRNQQVHCFNSKLQDRMQWASDQMEIHILPDGTRLFTGYWGGHEHLDLAL